MRNLNYCLQILHFTLYFNPFGVYELLPPHILILLKAQGLFSFSNHIYLGQEKPELSLFDQMAG